MQMPIVTYDPEADVLYVEFSDAEVAETVNLDDLRLIDYSRDGRIVGIEFVSASQGVDLRDIPFAPMVEKAIGGEGLPFKLYA